MIISASYKTDIPTFYGEWFTTRLAEGLCGVAEPYSGRLKRVSLAKEDVDGFVFWTKNVGPFLPALEQVHQKGHAFVLQHTINAYPREFEHRVVDADRSVELVKKVAALYGSRCAVWRYDTIIMSTLTDAQHHLTTFSRLAKALRGATDEVVVSFLQLYQKTERGLNAAAARAGCYWWDPPDDEKIALLRSLAAEAACNGMRLAVCGQPNLLREGIAEARCIDAPRLSDVAGRPIVARLGGGRRSCGCYHATDIGAYDTCPHGCVYCYAVSSERSARERFKAHNRRSPFLDPSVTGPLPDESPSKQLTLW